MTIGSDYPTPVMVNGFSCKNCTDVDYAKKHIDPAHPKSGPYGINAKDDPTVKNAPSAAVTFGGNLSSLNDRQTATSAPDMPDPSNGEATAQTALGAAIGAHLDVSA
jgi:hypothetical protein